MRHGLATAASRFALAGVGIDPGRGLRAARRRGRANSHPVHYRDARTTGVPDRVHAALPRPSFSGHRHPSNCRFNTIYQLAARPCSRTGEPYC